MNRSTPTTCLVLAAISMILVGCSHTSDSSSGNLHSASPYTAVTPLPVRDESISYHGPGSSKVNRDQFPAIRFASDSYLLPDDAGETLDSVASHLESTGASAILAGFTQPDEENRVLGERRALSVRQGLIDRGASPDRLQTVSYGHDLPSSSNAPDRKVEFGIVDPAQTAGSLPVTDAL